MIDRRRFLASLAAATLPAAAFPAAARTANASTPLGTLRPDPQGILDLPAEFTLTVVSRVGDLMQDGLRVPGRHDGMAAFTGDDGRVVLVCNHELSPTQRSMSAFGADFEALPGEVRQAFYDRGGSRTPGTGGTTTTVFNPRTGETERQHLSLAGTEINCAGGPTPWRTWLSCEECFESPGTTLTYGGPVIRERSHGHVFEVAADESGLVEPRPIEAMGKFEHEACAVHEPTGIVYMTEDRHHSLFYRFIPDVPGRLHEGGRLQALAIDGQPSLATHNWSRRASIGVGESLPVRWIDLDDVNPVENDLRLRGATAGAATFARGEGLCAAAGTFAFTCTIGGSARLGQIFVYTPSPREGQPDETSSPGQLVLLAESDDQSLLRNADNITLAPWGDLVVCEDTATHCGLVGVRPDGSQYAIADNTYSDSELAGVCFSPDGQTLFVNIQVPGMTVAITGPWPEVSA